MANIPSEEHIRELQEENDKAIADKTVEQLQQGKTFNISGDGHGSGVVPEEIWQNLPGKKEQNNG